MAQTNVQRRKAGFYYRQKIPADLLIHYGKREIVRSLGTNKKREASAAGYEQGHSWTRDFARIRAGGLQTVPRAIAEAQGLLEALDALPIEQAGERPQPKQAKVLLRTIDDDFVTKTCGTYLNEIDGADAEVRANRGMHGEINRLWSDLNGAPPLKDLQSMLSVGPIGQTVHDLLAVFLSDHNYVAGRGVPGYSKMCIRFLETLIRARQIVEDRNAGRPPKTEGIAPLALTFKANVDSHGLTIQGLHGIWAARETGTPKTTDEFLSIIREFQAFVVGQYRTDQAANVKKEHLIAYRNHLTKEGLKDKTITKKISTIKTLFTTAIEDSMLAPSEVQSVKVGKPKKRGKGGTKARLPFEIVELEKIFSPAIYLKVNLSLSRATPSEPQQQEAFRLWHPDRAQDARVAAISRPQSVPGGHGGADLGDAERAHARPGATTRCPGGGEPTDRGPLASVVVQRLHRESLLARPRRVRAAGHGGGSAGLVAEALCRRHRTAAPVAVAFPQADHDRRRSDARYLTGEAGPQKKQIVGRPKMFYGSRTPH
jgi:hypothetical protein